MKKVVALLDERGALFNQGKITHSFSALLADQNAVNLPRNTPVVYQHDAK